MKFAGLGARDILRTEAGLCLYGNEITEDISPAQAGLAWCIGKRIGTKLVRGCCCWLGRRRRKEGGFPGSKIILDKLADINKRRIGIISQGPLLRRDCEIVDSTETCIGHITSGCPSPTLGCNIAMAYVPKHIGISGNEIHILVRSKKITGKITKLPFIPCTYYVKR